MNMHVTVRYTSPNMFRLHMAAAATAFVVTNGDPALLVGILLLIINQAGKCYFERHLRGVYFNYQHLVETVDQFVSAHLITDHFITLSKRYHCFIVFFCSKWKQHVTGQNIVNFISQGP